MQPILPSNNYYPVYNPPASIPVPSTQPYYPQSIKYIFSSAFSVGYTNPRITFTTRRYIICSRSK